MGTPFGFHDVSWLEAGKVHEDTVSAAVLALRPVQGSERFGVAFRFHDFLLGRTAYFYGTAFPPQE
jgi:hypothetical protein